LSADGTQAVGINNAGQIVGSYLDAGIFHGFLLSGGTFTTIDVAAATHGTRAFGINDAGTIVGSFENASGEHGFVRSSSGLTGFFDGPPAPVTPSCAVSTT